MKTKLIITLFLVLPILGFSQIDQSVDLVTGIDYSYRNLSTSSEESMVLNIFEDREEREIGKLNWRLGLNYNRRLGKKIILRTGLQFASVGYKEKKRTGIIWGSEFNDMGEWEPDPSLPHEMQLKINYWFIGVPIAGRYEFSHKKFAPYFELGASPSIYLRTRIKAISDIGTEKETYDGIESDFNRFHVVGFASFGVNYSVNEQYQLFGQPTFRYHLTKLVDAPINEYLYDFGLEIGIRRKI